MLINRVSHSWKHCLAVLLWMASYGCASKHLEKHEFIEKKWGTGFRIVLYAADRPAAERAAAAAFLRVDQIGQAVSDYDPKSELSILCHLTDDGPMNEPAAVSEDLFRVLKASEEASRKSDGAFDATVGPMVKLWRRSRSIGQLPTVARRAAAKASVGWQQVALYDNERAVRLNLKGMRLDFGGIATGYATAEVLNAIREHGIRRALIDAGGDLAAGDPPPGKKNWVVAVQGFPEPDRPAGYVNLRNCAISTSGDTYRYVEIDGVRYSHIVDPSTGLGLTRRIGVTVIARDGVTADWLDTALPVMPIEKALALVEATPGAAARITELGSDGITVHETSRWRPFWSGPSPRTLPSSRN